MTTLIKLNLARNCIKYIIRIYGIKEIFVPYYTCNTVWHAIREEQCKINFYHINKNFMPEPEFKENDFILYNNYFGLCGNNCEKLAQKYKNIIIDNSHSFYTKHTGIASFNSLRKFFKVQNGAYLYIEKESSTKGFDVDNLELTPVIMQNDYQKFVYNELALNKEKNIKLISPEIEKTMNSIDFEQDKLQRLTWYQKYTKIFDKFNKIKLKTDENNIPYCYPLCTSDETILKSFSDNKLILLKLWNNIPRHFKENEFLNYTLALPLNDITTFNKIINIYK